MTTHATPQTPSDSASQWLDVALIALANHHRRFVCRHILSATGSVSVDSITTALVEDGSGQIDPELTEIELRHTHLPLLADAGFITYDPNDDAIDRARGVVTVDDVIGTLDDLFE